MPTKKKDSPLNQLIDQHIRKIKKFAASEIQARTEALERLNRLKQKASEFEESGVNILVKIRELQEGLATMIADDCSDSEVTKIRKKISSLKIDAGEHEVIAANLREKAIPHAEAEVKKINDQLSRGIAAKLDVCRMDLEQAAEKMLNEVMSDFKVWDAAVDELLNDLGTRTPDIGLIGGSERLALRITSEAVVKHFINFFALDLSIDTWRRQLGERFKKVQPIAEEPKQKTAAG